MTLNYDNRFGCQMEALYVNSLNLLIQWVFIFSSPLLSFLQPNLLNFSGPVQFRWQQARQDPF